MIILILGFLAVVSAGSNSDNKESYKNQLHSGHNGKHREKHDKNNYSSEHCTDPRTMKKHPAYTEWADAYSCTRHRCQPGGRNLAIYTVGCKRVEAPESAIECEEVVEDTNMQFPFCCTRLRCLVVVRGEVWTRVLGQPWEVLPAAPWSHMYKMKKPPPADSTFLPNKATILDPLFYSDPYLNHSRTSDQGPVYELTETDSEQNSHDKMMLRSDKNNEQTGRKSVSESSDYNEIPSSAKTAMPVPDIVIALSTNTDDKELSHNKKSDSPRHNKRRQSNVQPPPNYFEEQLEKEKQAKQLKQEVEEAAAATEKVEPELELTEEEKEKFFANSFYAVTQKPHKPHHRDNTNNSPISWTEIPLWNEPKDKRNLEPRTSEYNNDFNLQEPQVPEHREPKHEALQIPAKKVALDTKPNNLQALVDAIGTRMRDIESVVQKMSDKVHQVKATTEGSNEKKASNEKDGSHKRNKDYKRPSTEDENYMSDASNSILRRSNPAKVPKEPPPTYMAPVVENHHKSLHIAVPETSDDSDKKHKRHVHKKRRSKGAHLHKKRYRSKEDRRKHFNKLNSGDTEKNAVSVEESSDVGQ